MLNRITHYRTSHGFGVHSPFAFHFITCVLREKLPFYDFDRLPDHADRLLYRVANFFQPATVGVLGTDKSAVLRMALPGVRMVSSPAEADMTVAWGAVAEPIPPDCPVLFAVGAPAGRERWRQMQGMTFTNGKVGIAVNRAGLPHQDFTLSF